MFCLPSNTAAKEIETLFIEGLKIQIWECLPGVLKYCPNKRERFFYTVEDRIVGAAYAETISKIVKEVRWTFCTTKADIKDQIKDIEKQVQAYDKWKDHKTLSHRAKEPKRRLSVVYGIRL